MVTSVQVVLLEAFATNRQNTGTITPKVRPEQRRAEEPSRGADRRPALHTQNSHASSTADHVNLYVTPLSHTHLCPTTSMSDEVIGTCCALAITACLDVIAGICIDFLSVREYQGRCDRWI